METFTGRISKGAGAFGIHYWIVVPESICYALLQAGHSRVIVQIGDFSFRRALVSVLSEGKTLQIGKDLRKSLAVNEDQDLLIRIESDPNPNALDIPEELEYLLYEDETINALWEGLTIGYRRSMLIWVNGAKRAETRLNRAMEICRRLQCGEMIQRLKKDK